MCGIVGYVGSEECLPILINGLKRLEYRGYDSAGVALANHEKIQLIKAKGNLEKLEEKLNGEELTSNLGIGHTRWATHGIPSEHNAHPHTCCAQNIAIVHNGIIENYQSLKAELKGMGHKFVSETDTEVIAHLVEENLKSSNSLIKAVQISLKQLNGSYAVGVINMDEPNTIVAAKKDSPLVVGLSNDGNFIASDIPAILDKTNQVIIMDDNEIAVLKPEKVEIFKDGNTIEKEVTEITWSLEAAEKGGYEDFMLKEIHEQPEAVRKTLSTYIDNEKIDLGSLNLSEEEMREIDRVCIIACGTSYHAAWVGKLVIEEWAKIPVDIEISSEFRYRFPVLSKNTLLIAMTQSGETADTLAGIKESLKRGYKVAAITNVLGSTVTRQTAGSLITQAGPEIGVAATKTFTTQIIVLYLLALKLAAINESLEENEISDLIQQIKDLPEKIKEALKAEDDIKELAQKYSNKPDFLFLGRGYGLPIALEGALKLKEISYIHAEGTAAGEMKHGPIALIDDNCPVVAIANESKTYEKVISNIEEVKSRGADVIAVVSEKDTKLRSRLKNCMQIPHTIESLSPILTIIPLQLFSYYAAKAKGLNVDQPRNLAKSVTVE